MRNFIVGLMIGLLLGGGIAWAATRAVLQGGNGQELGTAANPLQVQSI